MKLIFSPTTLAKIFPPEPGYGFMFRFKRLTEIEILPDIDEEKLIVTIALR